MTEKPEGCSCDSYPHTCHPKAEQPTDATLLPCPFCGSDDVELRKSITDAMVACNNCGCRTGFVFFGASEAANAAKIRELTAAWNTRTMQAAAPTPNGEGVLAYVEANWANQDISHRAFRVECARLAKVSALAALASRKGSE